MGLVQGQIKASGATGNECARPLVYVQIYAHVARDQRLIERFWNSEKIEKHQIKLKLITKALEGNQK